MGEYKVWQAPESGKSVLPLLINMEKASDRLAIIQAHFDDLNLPLNRVEAVNGRAISFPIKDFSEISYKLLHGRRTCPAEVGCYLSHVKSAEMLLASSYDYALICEDDIFFHDDIALCLDKALQNSDDWDILRLTTVSNHKMVPYKAISAKYSLAIPLTRKKGTGAYLINRKAAKWIAKGLLPMRLAYDIAIDLEYLSGIKMAFAHPLPGHQSRWEESQIQGNIQSFKLPRWRYVTVLPYRTWLETSRVICRSAFLAYKLLRNVKLRAPRQTAPRETINP